MTIYDDEGSLVPSDRVYYATDANCNVTALFAADGTVIERYGYTPYGEATVYDGNWANPAAPTADGPLFCGYWFDAETGGYHVRAREYHPTLGTFTARDPLGFAAGDPNLYAYCGGKPISRTDPSGQVVVRHLHVCRHHSGRHPHGGINEARHGDVDIDG